MNQSSSAMRPSFFSPCFAPQIIQLMPDSKRAYNMNIALSKFNNYTFQELREAVIDLNPQVRVPFVVFIGGEVLIPIQ